MFHMRLTDFVKRLIPESVGGSPRNVWNTAVNWLKIPPVVYWLKIPPEFRPPFAKWLLNHLMDLRSDAIGRNRTPLWNWIEEHKPNKILEIGLGSGVNARKMIDLAENCTYFCFDNLSGSDVESYNELRKMPNTKFYIGDTIETLPEFVGSLPKMDLIFIDGAHDYIHVKNDWKACKKLMHSSTACFFHDYEGFGVRSVVDSIGEDFRINIITPPCLPIFALVRRK